jgi:hypothetical protein
MENTADRRFTTETFLDPSFWSECAFIGSFKLSFRTFSEKLFRSSVVLLSPTPGKSGYRTSLGPIERNCSAILAMAAPGSIE